MTSQQFALQTVKTIESSARSRYALRWTDCKRLAALVIALGYGCLLQGLTPLAAQTVSGVTIGDKNSLTVRKNTPNTLKKRELKCITGETYTLKTGETRPVYMSPSGKRYVLTANGSKYYPKRLNN